MPIFKLPSITLLALVGAIGVAAAQTNRPEFAQSDNQSQPGGSEMVPGMMGRNMIPSRMGEGMPMRGHMMKVVFAGRGLPICPYRVFAIADSDGDGAISFEELTAMLKRIFVAVDANNDGKVTPDEMQSFMQDK